MTTPTPQTFGEFRDELHSGNPGPTINEMYFAKLAWTASAQSSAARVRELEGEVKLERECKAACKFAVVDTIGGMVEGSPTHSGNYLQRLRELVNKEKRFESFMDEVLEHFEGMVDGAPDAHPDAITANYFTCEIKKMRGEL